MKSKRSYYNGKRCSKGEKAIAEYLEKNNINFIQEYSLHECLSSKGRPLRVDFFIPLYRIAIEFQGQHHYKPVNKFKRAERVHKETVFRDKQKKEYLLSNNIAILTIPYWEINDVETILREHIHEY